VRRALSCVCLLSALASAGPVWIPVGELANGKSIAARILSLDRKRLSIQVAVAFTDPKEQSTNVDTYLVDCGNWMITPLAGPNDFSRLSWTVIGPGTAGDMVADAVCPTLKPPEKM
jgi:hypothetical protein